MFDQVVVKDTLAEVSPRLHPDRQHLNISASSVSPYPVGQCKIATHRHEFCLQERVVHIVRREEHDHESDDDILVTLVECFRRGMPVD
jgi:hypothetical protein